MPSTSVPEAELRALADQFVHNETKLCHTQANVAHAAIILPWNTAKTSAKLPL